MKAVVWECAGLCLMGVWRCVKLLSFAISQACYESWGFYLFAYLSYICDSHRDLNSRLKTPLSFYVSTVCFRMHQVKTSLCHCRYIMQLRQISWADFDVRFSSSEVCRVMNIAWFCVAVFLEMQPRWISLDHLTVFSKVHLGHRCSFNLAGIILSTRLL